jgi:hypothetical protein
MNIIKNKNFKNHKKVLLLGAFVVCQIFGISFLSSTKNSYNFNVSATAPAQQDARDAATAIKDFVTQAQSNLIGNFSVIKGMAQQQVAALAPGLMQDDGLVKAHLASVYQSVTGQALPNLPGDYYDLNAVGAAGSDLAKLYKTIIEVARKDVLRQTGAAVGSHGIAFHIALLTLNQYILQKTMLTYFNFVQSKVNNIDLTSLTTQQIDSLKTTLSNCQSLFDDSSIRNLVDNASQIAGVVVSLNNIMSSVDSGFVPGLQNELKTKVADEIKGYVDRLNGDRINASVGLGMRNILPRIAQDIVDAFSSDRSQNISTVIFNSIIDYQEYKKANNNDVTHYMDCINNYSYKGFDVAELLSAAGKVLFPIGLRIGNVQPGDAGFTPMTYLMDYGLLHSFFSYDVGLGYAFYPELGMRMAAAAGNAAQAPYISTQTNIRIESLRGVEAYFHAGSAQYTGHNAGNINHINRLDTEAGAILDTKGKNILFKCFVNMLDMNMSKFGNASMKDILENQYTALGKLVDADGLNQAARINTPNYYVGKYNGANPEQGLQIDNNTANWEPTTFLYNPYVYENILKTNLFTQPPASYLLPAAVKVDQANDPNNALTVWGRYKQSLESYLTTLRSDMKAKLALAANKLSLGSNPNVNPTVSSIVQQMNAIYNDRTKTTRNKQIEIIKKYVELNSQDRSAVRANDALVSTIKGGNYIGLFNNYDWYDADLAPDVFATYNNSQKAIMRAIKQIYQGSSYEDADLPQELKNGQWKTITIQNYRNAAANWNDTQRTAAHNIYKLFSYAPFNGQNLQTGDALYDSSKTDNYIDLRTINDMPSFRTAVPNKSKRIEIYKWLQSEEIIDFPWMEDEENGTGEFNPDSAITPEDFWSSRHSDLQRKQLVDTNNGTKMRFAQPEYNSRNTNNYNLLKSLDLYTMDAAEYRALSSQQKEAIKIARPFYAEMFRYAPFSSNETVTELLDKDMRKILYNGLNGQLSEWNSLSSSAQKELQERNRYFRYLPFVDEDDIDLKVGDKTYINWLPDEYKYRMLEIYKNQIENKDREPYNPFRDRDYDAYAIDDDIERSIRRQEKVALSDLGYVNRYDFDSRNLKAFSRLDSKVLGQYMDLLLNGRLDSYATGKEEKHRWYFNSLSSSKQYIFRLYTALSTLLGLKRLEQQADTTGDRNKIRDMAGQVKAKIEKYLNKHESSRSIEEYYYDAMKNMKDVISNINSKHEEKTILNLNELLKGFGSLFYLDYKTVSKITRPDSKFEGTESNDIINDLAYSRTIIENFWKTVIDKNAADDSIFLKNISNSSEDDKNDQRNAIGTLFKQIRATQLDIADKTNDLVSTRMWSKGDSKTQAQLRDINDSNETPFTSRESFVSNIRNIAGRINAIVKDKRDLFGSSSYDSMDFSSFGSAQGNMNLRGGIKDILVDGNKTFKELYKQVVDANEYVRKHGSREDFRGSLESAMNNARTNYSSNQRELLLRLIRISMSLCDYFKRKDVWDQMRFQDGNIFGTIQTAINDIITNKRIDITKYEEELKRGRLSIPSERSSFGEYDYDGWVVIDSKDETKNPFVIIRKALEENDKLNQEAYAKEGKESYTNKSNLYFNLIKEFISGVYFLQYFCETILKDSMLFTTYNIARGMSDTESISKLGYSYDSKKDPMENLKDNLEALLKVYENYSSTNRFVIEGGYKDSSPLGEVKRALEKLKTNSNFLNGLDASAADAKAQAAEEKEADEEAEKEEEKEEDKDLDEEEADEDSKEDSEEESEEESGESDSESNESSSSEKSVNEQPVQESTEVEVTLLAHSHAEVMGGTFTGKLQASNGAISGTVTYTDGNPRGAIFGDVFENGVQLKDNSGKAVRVLLNKEAEGRYSFSYTPTKPNIYVEIHLYDRSHPDDADGILRERLDHFCGSLGIANTGLLRTPSKTLLNVPKALNGSGAELNNAAIDKFVYEKQANGDLLIKFSKEMQGPTKELIVCFVPKDGLGLERIEDKYVGTLVKSTGQYIVQVPAAVMGKVKELHTYEKVMLPNNFRFKVPIDINNVKSAVETVEKKAETPKVVKKAEVKKVKPKKQLKGVKKVKEEKQKDLQRKSKEIDANNQVDSEEELEDLEDME